MHKYSATIYSLLNCNLAGETARHAVGAVAVRCWKKQMPSCSGKDRARNMAQSKTRGLPPRRSRCPLPTGVLSRENLWNLFQMGKQMAVALPKAFKGQGHKTGAPVGKSRNAGAKRLQIGIAKRIVWIHSIIGSSHQGDFNGCLSRMRGNFHVRFLGGKGAVRLLTYPIQCMEEKENSWALT
jgi:hypothetical protein